MPWGCDSNSPGGASGRRLAQPKETFDDAPDQSCTQAAPTPPADPETTGSLGLGSARWSQQRLPSLESQAWFHLKDWACELGGDLERVDYESHSLLTVVLLIAFFFLAGLRGKQG